MPPTNEPDLDLCDWTIPEDTKAEDLRGLPCVGLADHQGPHLVAAQSPPRGQRGKVGVWIYEVDVERRALNTRLHADMEGGPIDRQEIAALAAVLTAADAHQEAG